MATMDGCNWSVTGVGGRADPLPGLVFAADRVERAECESVPSGA